MPVITSGSLFLGDFEVDTKNTLNSTQFGIPYFQKPIRVKGYYKYKPEKSTIIVKTRKIIPTKPN
ncbi:MAG: PCMD domain-containing protein [Odoribacter splanchnicus]